MTKEPTPEEIAAWQSFLMAYAMVIRILEQEMEEEQGLPWFGTMRWHN